jgi:hypothetical protein
MKTWGSSQSESVKGNGIHSKTIKGDNTVGNTVLLQEGEDWYQGYWGTERALIVSTFHCRDVHHIPSRLVSRSYLPWSPSYPALGDFSPDKHQHQRLTSTDEN